MSWAPVPNKPTVSVDVKQHSTNDHILPTQMQTAWEGSWRRSLAIRQSQPHTLPAGIESRTPRHWLPGLRGEARKEDAIDSDWQSTLKGRDRAVVNRIDTGTAWNETLEDLVLGFYDWLAEVGRRVFRAARRYHPEGVEVSWSAIQCYFSDFNGPVNRLHKVTHLRTNHAWFKIILHQFKTKKPKKQFTKSQVCLHHCYNIKNQPSTSLSMDK